MGVQLLLIEHRFLGSVACLIAALINVVEKRFRFSIQADWSYRPFVHRMMFGCRRSCFYFALMTLELESPPRPDQLG